MYFLCSQGVELLDGRRVLPGPLFHLALMNHMDCFDPAQGNPSIPERFESQRRTDFLLDEPVVLFNNVIKVFTLSDLYSLTEYHLNGIFFRES